MFIRMWGLTVVTEVAKVLGRESKVSLMITNFSDGLFKSECTVAKFCSSIQNLEG